MRKKIFFSLIVIVILGFFSVTLFKSQRVKSQEEKVIRIGILRVPNDVAAARERNKLAAIEKDTGYKIKYYTFDSGVDANKALMSNSIDMATMGHTNAVVAMSANLPVKLVWVNDVIGNNEQLVVKKSAKVNSINDLKGKTIATPFASTSHYSLMMFLQAHKLLNQVKLVDMQTTEIVAAWRRGDIDAAYTWEPSLSNLNDAKTITSSKKMAASNYLTANVMLATNQFRNKHPELLTKCLTILGKEHRYYNQNPEQTYQLTGRYLDISSTEAKKQVGESQWLDPVELKQFMNNQFTDQFYQTCLFMGKQQTLNSKPTLNECCKFIDANYIKE